MSTEIFLILAIAAMLGAAVLVLRGATRAPGVRGVKVHDVQRYDLELNDAGKLEVSIVLLDGRELFFVADPMVVYDLSNAFLAAASRMGAKRHGMVELADPSEAAPHNPSLAKRVVKS